MRRNVYNTLTPLFLIVLAGAVFLSSCRTDTEPAVLAGIDVLVRENFAPLTGKRVGVITNHTGLTADGRSLVTLLAEAPTVDLVAIFAPEHGLKGEYDQKYVSGRNAATGLQIFSLYGDTRRPTSEMLEGIDVLVFDIQGAGVRYYTFGTTMAYAMEEAAKRGIEFVVLDRPSPLNGAAVNGPVLDADKLGFVGYFPLPLRHGMTLGELALMYNAENRIEAQLTVIKMDGWRRGMWFDETGIRWVDPSPALRSVPGNLFYPAVELLRAGGVSVGRGTETPFEVLGAPWIDEGELEDYLNEQNIPGVRFERARYTPDAYMYEGEECGGVRLIATDRDKVNVGLLGVELLAAMEALYPEEFELEKAIRLLGSGHTLERLMDGDDPKDIAAGWKDDLAAFHALREKYLLY